jgi:hypothetical protein
LANQNQEALGLNLLGRRRDIERTPPRGGKFRGGQTFMQSIRPDSTDPIPLRTSPHRMSTIMIRFVGLLFAAVVILALAWSR